MTRLNPSQGFGPKQQHLTEKGRKSFRKKTNQEIDSTSTGIANMPAKSWENPWEDFYVETDVKKSSDLFRNLRNTVLNSIENLGFSRKH